MQNSKSIPDILLNPKFNFQSQRYFNNSNVVKSGIEKSPMATLLTVVHWITTEYCRGQIHIFIAKRHTNLKMSLDDHQSDQHIISEDSMN